MFKKATLTQNLLLLVLIALTLHRTDASCSSNEKRPENQAACAGHYFGAVVSYPGDCSKFLVCVPTCKYPKVEQCPSGLWWDNKYKFCNIPQLVDCNGNVGEETTEEVVTIPTSTTAESNETTTKGRCNNERRAENKAACVGQRWGALVAYPGDCSKFLVCTRICEYPVVENCLLGLWWDNTHKICNIPKLVKCENSAGTTLPSEETTTEVVTIPTTTTTQSGGICNNERRPENKAACAGQRWGALVAYPGDCSKFLVCTRICEYPVVENCPLGLWWDNTYNICNFPILVNCDNNAGTTLSTDKTTTEVVTNPTDSSTTTTATSSSTEAVTNPPTTTISTTTTTESEGKCNNERRPENKAACDGHRGGALVAYPGDCSKFLVCTRKCEYPRVEHCPLGLWWDNTHKFCDIPILVNCDNSAGTTLPTDKTTTDAITNPIDPTTTTTTTSSPTEFTTTIDNNSTSEVETNHPPTTTTAPSTTNPPNPPTTTTSPSTTPINDNTTSSSPITTTESNDWGRDCIAPAGMSADICLPYNNNELLRYPYDCNAYINCTMGCPVMNYCPPDKVFNNVLEICDIPGTVHCEELTMPTEIPSTTKTTTELTTPTTEFTTELTTPTTELTTPTTELTTPTTEFTTSTTDQTTPTTTTPTTEPTTELTTPTTELTTPTTQFTTSTTDQTTPTTTSSPILTPSEICADQEEGTCFPYDENCQQFIYCKGKGGFYILDCRYGTYYDSEKGYCLKGDPNACRK